MIVSALSSPSTMLCLLLAETTSSGFLTRTARVRELQKKNETTNIVFWGAYKRLVKTFEDGLSRLMLICEDKAGCCKDQLSSQCLRDNYKVSVRQPLGRFGFRCSVVIVYTSFLYFYLHFATDLRVGSFLHIGILFMVSEWNYKLLISILSRYFAKLAKLIVPNTKQSK